MSEMCVSATARSALQRGIAVVLAHGAHATYDIPARPAATVARVAERALGAQLELPATSKDIMFTATARHRWRDRRAGLAGPCAPASEPLIGFVHVRALLWRGPGRVAAVGDRGMAVTLATW
jgi:hypothetical protein